MSTPLKLPWRRVGSGSTSTFFARAGHLVLEVSGAGRRFEWCVSIDGNDALYRVGTRTTEEAAKRTAEHVARQAIAPAAQALGITLKPQQRKAKAV